MASKEVPNEFLSIWPAGVSVVLAKMTVADAPLHPEELSLVEGVCPRRAMEIRAGRSAARQALCRLGAGQPAITRGLGREPIWPPGFVGSISHCDDLVCSVVASESMFRSLGVDVERAGQLGIQESVLVCRPEELIHFESLPALYSASWPEVTFSAKEALYKCLYPIVRAMIDFQQVSLRFSVDAQDPIGDWELVAINNAWEIELGQIRGRWALSGGYILASAVMALANHPNM